MKSEFDLTHSNGIYIPHFSASTINSFIENRYQFFQSKVMMAPFTGSIHTCRGTAVEHGVNTWLEKPETENLGNVALTKYDEEIKNGKISKIEAEEFRDTIVPLLNVALKHYKSEFSKDKVITQHRIKCMLDGVTRPIVGYLDFYRPNVMVNDSKVTGKTPSKLKQSYVLQGALYKQATGLDVTFDFFIPNKTAVHKAIQLTDKEYEFGLGYLTKAATVLEELQECTDTRRVMELMSFPNLEAMWTEGEKKKAAKIWDINYIP